MINDIFKSYIKVYTLQGKVLNTHINLYIFVTYQIIIVWGIERDSNWNLRET